MVERLLPKQDIVSSNLITRSKQVTGMKDRHILPEMAERRFFYVSTNSYTAKMLSCIPCPYWGDIDIMSELVKVKRGKGGMARSAVIGATTRRVLLAYRRTLGNPSNDSPLFLS